MSYYRLVISRAFGQTRNFWNVHQVWKYASPFLTAVVLRLLLRRLAPVIGWEGFLKELVGFAIGGFFVTWVGSYLINLVQVPRILHCELVEENRKLKSAAYPEVAPDEQRRRQFVRNLMQKYGAGGRKVIQFILDTGITNGQAMFNAGLPSDLTPTLNDAMMDGILELDRSSGRYSIRPELCCAIGFVLEHWASTDHP